MRNAILTAIGLVCIFWGVQARAQGGTPPAAQQRSASASSGDSRVRHERRWWEFFFGPAKKTAAEQMAYADLLRASGRLRAASGHYRALVYAWPDAPEAPAAQFAYAELLAARGQLESAFEQYQFLIETYPGYFSYLPVLERQYHIAKLIESQRRGFWIFSWREHEKAIEMYRKIVQNAPQWERAPEVQFKIGELQQALGEYLLAASAYDVLQQRYSGSPFAEKAGFEKGRCYYLLARRHRNSNDIHNMAAAMLSEFIARYPAAAGRAEAIAMLNELREAQAELMFRQGRVYDWSVGRPAAAVIMYEKLVSEHAGSKWAALASARLEHFKAVEEKGGP